MGLTLKFKAASSGVYTSSEVACEKSAKKRKQKRQQSPVSKKQAMEKTPEIPKPPTGPFFDEMYRLEPVSYTHLTLPTILLV